MTPFDKNIFYDRNLLFKIKWSSDAGSEAAERSCEPARQAAPGGVFPFLHLGDQKGNSLVCNLVNLLADSADRIDSLLGNRRTVEADEFVIVRQGMVPLRIRRFKKNIGMIIVGEEDAPFLTGIFLFDVVKDFLQRCCGFLIGESKIPNDNLVRYTGLYTGILETSETAVGRNIFFGR